MYCSICMCVLIALAATADSILDPSQEASFNALKQECANETGFDLDIYDPMKQNLTESNQLDSKARCYMACLWRKGGVVKEDGTLDVVMMWEELSSNVADPEGVRQALNECSNQKGASVCETATKAIECLRHKEAFGGMRPKGDKI